MSDEQASIGEIQKLREACQVESEGTAGQFGVLPRETSSEAHVLEEESAEVVVGRAKKSGRRTEGTWSEAKEPLEDSVLEAETCIGVPKGDARQAHQEEPRCPLRGSPEHIEWIWMFPQRTANSEARRNNRRVPTAGCEQTARPVVWEGWRVTPAIPTRSPSDACP